MGNSDVANYRTPMLPLPQLELFACRAILNTLNLSLFIYDKKNNHTQPVIILIHGLGDDADTWRHVLIPLASSYRVIALDLPGFARSDKPETDYSLSYFSKVILSMMDELGIHRAILVGNSLGAMIAQHIALNHLERVVGLVLVDGALITPYQHLDLKNLLFLTPFVGEWLYTRLRKDPQKAFESLRPYYASFDLLPESDKTFLFKRVNQRVWNDHQRRAYFSTIRNTAGYLLKKRQNLKARISDSLIPTLIIWGENDRIIPVSNAHHLVGIHQNARLILIPNSGHLPHQEQPSAFVEAIHSDERICIAKR